MRNLLGRLLAPAVAGILVGIALGFAFLSRPAIGDDCTVDCTNCSADPVFIQKDFRDPQGLLLTRAALAEAKRVAAEKVAENSDEDPEE